MLLIAGSTRRTDHGLRLAGCRGHTDDGCSRKRGVRNAKGSRYRPRGY
jgi:hypothetical protein